MAPRKRAKPNPREEPKKELKAAESPAAAPSQIPLPEDSPPTQDASTSDDTKDKPVASDSRNKGKTNADDKTGSEAKPSKSNWYGKTWPRKGSKAAPVTQIARESITAAGNAVSELATPPSTPRLASTTSRAPSLRLPRTITNSSVSLPAPATTSKVHITSNGEEASKDEVAEADNLQLSKAKEADDLNSANGKKEDDDRKPAAVPATPSKPESNSEAVKEDVKATEAVRNSWLGWFSKGDPITEEPQKQTATATIPPEDPPQSPQHHASFSEPSSAEKLQRRRSDPSPLDDPSKSSQQPRSWLHVWGNAMPAPKQDQPKQVIEDQTDAQSDPNPAACIAVKDHAEVTKPANTNCESRHPEPPATPTGPGKSSGWAFWTRDSGQEGKDGSSGSGQPQQGELAVAGSPSQKKPEKAVVDEVNDDKKAKAKSTKDKRPRSIESQEAVKKVPVETKPVGEATSAPSPAKAKDQTPTPSLKEPQKLSQTLLLPSFEDSFPLQETPTLLQQITRLIYPPKPPATAHLEIIPNPPQIKRALAIGVHGYFPAPLIRSVLGQPTGTSIKFANMAEKAIERWTLNHGYSCQIEKVALEGEGMIAERVDLLWKLLLNWIEDIRKADFILVACHSQGVPVALELVAKLVQFGCVSNARIGVCAMAGVNLGPFPDFKSRWISGSAAELFDFSKPDSKVSEDYLAALEVALKAGVKIVYVGSIDDQLVPMEVYSLLLLPIHNLQSSVY